MNICCCILLFALIAIMFVPLLFKGHRYSFKDISITSSFSDAVYKHKIHLNDDLVAVVVNKTFDPCFDSFNYACKTGTETILDSINKHNKRLRQRIRDDYIRDTPFYTKCVKFHNTGKENAQLLETMHYKEAMRLVNGLQDHERLEFVLGELFRMGIKILFESTFLDISNPEEFTIERAPKFASAATHLKDQEKWSLLEKRLLEEVTRTAFTEQAPSVRDALDMEESFSDTNDETSKTNLENHKGQFKFREYLGRHYKSTMYIDTNLISEFETKKHIFTIQKWKNYLHIGVLYNLLLHYRVGLHNSEDTCIRQYEALFPFDVCHHVKDLMKIDIYYVKDVFKSIRNGFVDWIKKNAFKHKPSTIEAMSKRMSEVKLITDHCWLKRDETHKPFFLELENSIMKMDGEYTQIIYEVFRSDLSFYRNEHADKYLRNLEETFTTWNGYYNNKDNALIVPSGLIHFLSTEANKGGCIFEAFLSYFFGHELSHCVHRELLEKEPNNAPFNSYLDYLQSRYGRDFFKEVVADAIGSEVAFVYGFKKKDQKERECFFLTVTKIWCNDIAFSNHPTGSKRVKITIDVNRPAYNELFCTKKK